MVKYVDDLDENWHSKASYQHVYVWKRNAPPGSAVYLQYIIVHFVDVWMKERIYNLPAITVYTRRNGVKTTTS